jgi:hypothetical protein
VLRLVAMISVLTADPPDDNVKGFRPPVTVMRPKGAVTVRPTVPVYPFRLVAVMFVVLLDPKMLRMFDGEDVMVKSWLETTWTDSSVDA